MTVLEMVAEVRRGLGNRTDVDDARILLWLNWAEQEICGYHRKLIVSPRRFHVLEGDLFFEVGPYAGTSGASAGLEDDTVQLPTTWTTPAVAASTVADFYKDWIIEYGTEKRIILSNTAGGLATVSEDWTTVPNSASITVYQRILPIGAGALIDADDIWSIERVEQAVDGTIVDQVVWESVTGIDPTGTGTPGSFARRGDTLVFDTAPDAWTKYKLFYYKHQSFMVLTGNPTLPLQWHSLIVLGAIYRGFRALMEPQRAQQSRSEFLDAAVNMRDEREWDSSRISRKMTVRVSR